MSKRIWTAVLAGVLTTASLVGCGSGDSDETPTEVGTFEGRGPITYVAAKDSTGTVKRLVDVWNADNPDQKVTLVELPSDADAQRQQMIQNAQTESDTYTVLNLDVVWTSEFAANRWIDPLPKEEFPLDEMLPPAVEAATYRDTLYAVPNTVGGGVLYYRKDLLDKAGIATPPTTIAELEEACDEVAKLPEAEGTSCYAGQFEKFEGLTVNFCELVGAAGGHVVDDEGKPDVDTPEAATAAQWLVDGFESGLFPAEAITYEEENGRQAFQAGKLVFHRQWPYQYTLANATDGSSKVAGKFDVAPLPGFEAPGASTLGGNQLAISRFADNKATALEFVQWFSNQENALANLEVTSNTPAYTALYDDPAMVKKYPYLPALKESLLSAVPRPRVVRYGDVTAAIQDAAYAMITGETPVDEGLASLQSDLESLTAP